MEGLLFMFIKFCIIFYHLIIFLLTIPLFFLKGLVTVILVVPRYFIYGIYAIFRKKKIKKNYFSRLIFVLSTLVYLICIFLISRWVAQNVRIKLMSDEIINTTKIFDDIVGETIIDDEGNNSLPSDDNSTPSFSDSDYKVYDYRKYADISYLSVDFNKLILQNTDTVGWIKINGTNINYPFVQGKDNSYYLNHSFDKKKNYAGWIFGDYRNNMDNMRANTIIYGHNVLNNNLFGTLPRVLKKSWYTNEDNLIINISTPNKKMIWKIFSIYEIEPEAYYLRTIFDDDEYETFIKTIKDRSIYDFGDIITTSDKILTLSTCDNSGKYRIVVHARLVGTIN